MGRARRGADQGSRRPRPGARCETQDTHEVISLHGYGVRCSGPAVRQHRPGRFMPGPHVSHLLSCFGELPHPGYGPGGTEEVIQRRPAVGQDEACGSYTLPTPGVHELRTTHGLGIDGTTVVANVGPVLVSDVGTRHPLADGVSVLSWRWPFAHSLTALGERVCRMLKVRTQGVGPVRDSSPLVSSYTPVDFTAPRQSTSPTPYQWRSR
jgi:hypothetical protein